MTEFRAALPGDDLRSFRWRKLGRVFNPRTDTRRWWMRWFAQAPATVVFDDFVRVYVSGRPDPEPGGVYTSYSGFIDLDRRNLLDVVRVSEDPILPLGRRGTFDEFGIYPVSVCRREPGYWAYYAGWTRCESVPFNTAIGVATSEDGVRFERMGEGPVLSYSPTEPFVISGPKIRRFGDQWILFYIAGRKWKLDQGSPEPVYKIRMAVSEDGIDWRPAQRDLIESRLEDDEAQASPDVFRAGGRYHMFFCYRYSTGFRSHERGYRIGYASSTDLSSWERRDDLAAITVSESGWDSEMVAYPHVFELDGEIYMMYLGDGVGREGFGLARLEDAPW